MSVTFCQSPTKTYVVFKKEFQYLFYHNKVYSVNGKKYEYISYFCRKVRFTTNSAYLIETGNILQYTVFNLFKFIPKVGARPSTQGKGKMNKKLKGGKKLAKKLKDVHST
jgi:hypothetical protein